jgi:hypothetical protein
MTVGELKILLADVDDDIEVLIPHNAEEGFNGFFFSPCSEDSGLGDAITDDPDDYDPLINPAPTEQSFFLVPCNFFVDADDEEQYFDPQLN